MARFGQGIIQQLTNPFGDSMFNLGAAIGSAPRRRREKEEEERKQKGLLGGLMSIQQAAQLGQLDPSFSTMAAKELQDLGMSPENVMSALTQAQSIQQQVMEKRKEQAKEKRILDYFNSRGTEYADQYKLGVEPSKILENIAKKDDRDGKIAIGNTLGIPAEISAGLTSNELASRLDNQKTERGVQTWSNWIKQNPEITPENRGEALNAALEAFGKDAPSKIADLELKQLQRKAEQDKRNLRDVKVTLNTSSLLSGGFGDASKIKTEKLALDANGNFTPETIEWLNAHATYAFEPISGKSWPTEDSPLKSVDNTLTGQQDSSNTTPTLRQFIEGRR